MIDKILSYWIVALLVLLGLMLTFGMLIATIIVSCFSNNYWWLLLNLSYLILTPLFIYLWKYIIELLKNGDIL